jgi:hypothetical protein
MINELVNQTNQLVAQGGKHVLSAANEVAWGLSLTDLANLLDEQGGMRYTSAARRIRQHESGENVRSGRDFNDMVGGARQMAGAYIAAEVRAQ